MFLDPLPFSLGSSIHLKLLVPIPQHLGLFSYLAHIHGQSLESFLLYCQIPCPFLTLSHLLGEITILVKSMYLPVPYVYPCR